MRNWRVVFVAIVAVAVFAGAAAGCGSDDGSDVRSSGCGGSGSGAASGSASGAASGSGTGTCAPAAKCDPFGNKDRADTTVQVTLNEFTVQLDKASVPAGMIHFALDNKGKEPHEFVVVEAASRDALPLDKDGALEETKLPKGSVVGEVEPFPGGKTCDGTFDLAAGRYQLLCNIVETDNGKPESHLHEGMVVSFEVT
jgi:hypothetical protein